MKKFLNEVKGEFKKVIWPSKSESIDATALVIGLTIALGIYLAIFDVIFVNFLHLFV